MRGESNHSERFFTRQQRQESPMMPQCSVTTQKWMYVTQCRSHPLCQEIDFFYHFGWDSSKDFMTITSALTVFSGWEDQNDLGLKITTLIIFVQWTSVSTCGWAFLLYVVNLFYTFISGFNKDKVIFPLFVSVLFTVSIGDVLLPGANNDIFAVRMEQ